MKILVPVFLLICTAAAANSSLTILPRPTFENCGYYIHYPDSTGIECRVYYKRTVDEKWKRTYPPIFSTTHPKDIDTTEFRGSIVGLAEHTQYDLKAELWRGGSEIENGSTTFTTWTDSPPISTTHNIADVYRGGPWNLSNVTGTDGGWIRFLGDGTTIIDGADLNSYAVHIQNCHYVIFENLKIKGGGRWGVWVDEDNKSDHIRFINCEIYNWGRIPDHIDQYGWYCDADGKGIDLDHALLLLDVNQAVVERCYIHDPNGLCNCFDPAYYEKYKDIIPLPHGGADGGPNGICVYSNNSVIRYNDIVGTTGHTLKDGITSYGGDHGGLYRDCDCYGNMVAGCNDDAIEVDGAGMNLRAYRNCFVQDFGGFSGAPITEGPCYVFRNVVTCAGDPAGTIHPVAKMGGGTLSTGWSFWFNNTFYVGDDVFSGVGYGSDPHPLISKFLAKTRNNMFISTGNSKWAIDDPYEYADTSSTHYVRVNDFDYDLIGGGIRARPGAEPHAMHSLPTWTDSKGNLFTLQLGSKGIDSGQLIYNFSDGYAGSAPDLGAFEYGEGGMIPYRPINVAANKYRIVTSGVMPETITLTVGALSDSTYTVEQSPTVDWVSVSPASGKLTHGTVLTFVADPTVFAGTERGMVFVRLKNGYSIPILVTAQGGTGRGQDTMQGYFSNDMIVKYLFVIFACVWGVVEISQKIKQRKHTRGDPEETGSLILLCVGIALGYAIGIPFAFSKYGRIDWGSPYLIVFGLLLILGGLGIRTSVLRTPASYHTYEVGTQAGRQSLHNGLYRYSRHPGNIGQFLILLGIGVAFTNWISLIGLLLPIFVAFIWRTRLVPRIY
jgi:protein-S-isoprenylcysteine O-methyltransferase Ste14